jgi:hypothetical protein
MSRMQTQTLQQLAGSHHVQPSDADQGIADRTT